jgi:poly(hydroxyalkanoate) granule-associated protein
MKNKQTTEHESESSVDQRNEALLSLGQRIKESAGQIWLAGLGAYVKAEKEGSRLFDALVKDGKRIEATHQRSSNESEPQDQEGITDSGSASDDTAVDNGRIDQRLAACRDIVEERVEEVKDRASSSWERLEKAFDERVARALGRLNIPTKADVEALSQRIEELSTVIEKMAEAQSAQQSVDPGETRKRDSSSDQADQ